MGRTGYLLRFLPLIFFLSMPGCDPASGAEEVNIHVEYTQDLEDRNEWGTRPGGDNIQAEWGELVTFDAISLTPVNRSVLMIWKITNLHSGNSTIHSGGSVQMRFQPSDRRLDIIQRTKFLVELTVYYIRSNETAAYSFIQIWVSSDDDNDNDGMPDRREIFYWGEDIHHHHPGYDEDGDGFTNVQEIGFDLPLAECEKPGPFYHPACFNPTDPDSPLPRPIRVKKTNTSNPNGPVMPVWAAYMITVGIASIGLLSVLFVIGYVMNGVRGMEG